ncbi:MAG: glucuronate isomerase [Clostridia bacterium]|nr:glucuronate isomerase [Clostridia bacterium]
MQDFLTKDFMLHTETARQLFFDYAQSLPIVDYHCHLSPKEIAEDAGFSNITEAWLYGDHYKWRAMRSCGIEESKITGNASDFDKFAAYCSIMPKLIGNPLYHWSHLELRRYFDCDLIINPKNCNAIWEETAEKLKQGMTARNLIRSSGVEILCTTDDPADDLPYHKLIAESGFETKVFPAFRPDKGMNLRRSDFRSYMEKLGASTGKTITTLEDVCDAYVIAMDRFAEAGCVLADHGLDNGVSFVRPVTHLAGTYLTKALNGDKVTEEEAVMYQSYMARFFGREYKRRGWTMQLHFGVLRNPNEVMFKKLGPDSGFDTVHGKNTIYDLAMLLNDLEQNDALPRTILYSVNASDNAAVAALCSSFCRGDGSGKPTVLQGSAWWFNDHDEGMRAQIRTYASESALGNSLGMLTDSRSFLSYPRHEYYRRILCDEIGRWVENGDYPNDPESLKSLIYGICYGNARQLFE